MPPKAAILSPDLHQMAKLVLLVSIPRGSAVARQPSTLAQNLDASTLRRAFSKPVDLANDEFGGSLSKRKGSGFDCCGRCIVNSLF